MQEGLYRVGNLLGQPLDTAETITLPVLDGQTVTVTVTNTEDGISVAITGAVVVEESCARCGKSTKVTLTLPGEPVITEPRAGIINLCDSSNDEIELARPLVAYCDQCK